MKHLLRSATLHTPFVTTDCSDLRWAKPIFWLILCSFRLSIRRVLQLRNGLARTIAIQMCVEADSFKSNDFKRCDTRPQTASSRTWMGWIRTHNLELTIGRNPSLKLINPSCLQSTCKLQSEMGLTQTGQSVRATLSRGAMLPLRIGKLIMPGATLLFWEDFGVSR